MVLPLTLCYGSYTYMIEDECNPVLYVVIYYILPPNQSCYVNSNTPFSFFNGFYFSGVKKKTKKQYRYNFDKSILDSK